MWYILDGKSDKSLCLVYEKNILQAGSTLNEGDAVVFFYNGDRCEGNILRKNADREILSAKLTEMSRELKNGKGKGDQGDSAGVLSTKRRSEPTKFYGKSTNVNLPAKRTSKSMKPIKISEEEKTRQRILEMNRKDAQKKANYKIIAAATSKLDPKDPDKEWLPGGEEDSMDSVIGDKGKQNDKMKKLSNALIEKILHDDGDDNLNDDSIPKSNPSSPFKDGDSTSDPFKPSPTKEADLLPSPSKEELKRQLEKLKRALENKDHEGANSSHGFKTPDKGSTKDKRMVISTSSRGFKTPEKGHHSTKEKRIVPGSLNTNGSQSSPNSFSGLFQDKSSPGKSTSEDGKLGLNSSRKSDKILSPNQGDSSFGSVGDKSSDKEVEDMIESFSTNDYIELDHQLYGPIKGSKDIGHGIYCKGEALTQALTSSTNVNHVLRRVMSGVFNPAEILNCTVTGKSWNAGGPDHKGKEMTALHPTALQAIFEFSNKFAKHKKWSTLRWKSAKPIMAVRLTELKKKASK